MPFIGSAHGAVSYGRAKREATWVNGGVVTTLAGNGSPAFADGTGTGARFSSPTGVAVLSNGNIVVADQSNHRIRLVTPLGVVTTLAGSTGAFADGTGTAARFNVPQGVAVLPDGNIVVADTGNCRIRLVTPAGVVTTIAGSATAAFADGTGTAASFQYPCGVAALPNGNIVVADQNNHCIRLVTQAGVVTTLAGNGTAAFADGTGTGARFQYPGGVAVLSNGNIVVADQHNQRVRLVTSEGVVTTLAGQAGSGSTDGTGTGARFSYPQGVALNPLTGVIVVADTFNYRIRLVTQAGVVTTLAGQTTAGSADGTGTGASFNRPTGVAVTSSGVIVVADQSNHSIRLIT
jgi:glucose/arabinose dehydrogenase